MSDLNRHRVSTGNYFFSVQPLCLCVSVVHYARETNNHRKHREHRGCTEKSDQNINDPETVARAFRETLAYPLACLRFQRKGQRKKLREPSPLSGSSPNLYSLLRASTSRRAEHSRSSV